MVKKRMVTPALPIPLLLDNNALLTLAQSEFVNPHLDLLSELATAGKISILFPTALQEEWNKHKGDILRDIRKLEREKAKVIHTFERIASRKNTLSDEEFDEIKIRLLSRVEMLDGILTNHVIKIPRRTEFDSTILDWRRQKKAPFHQPNKNDHINDAEILYYSIDYLRQAGPSQLVFVSNDQSAYSLSPQEKEKLHPDCSMFCPEVTIVFFSEVSPALDQLESWLLPGKARKPDGQKQNKAFTVEIDRSLPVIWQVLVYLQFQLKICRRWPPHLLTAQYPFLADPSYAGLKRPYTLVTDNQELYDLLTQVRVDDDCVKYFNDYPPLSAELEGALKQVLRVLFDHLLFRIAFKTRNGVALQYIDRFANNIPPFRQFYTLDLPGLLQFLDEPETDEGQSDPDKVMARAYYCYKTQQYKTATQLLLRLRDEPTKLNPVQNYIIHFNLSLLKHLLTRIPPPEPEVDKLLEICRAIDLEVVRETCSKPESEKIVRYIHEQRFLHDPILDVTDALEDIRRLYLQQSAGSSASTDTLIEQFFLATEFLAGNFIIFDQFTQFNGLARPFAQGLLTAAFCSPLQAARLPGLNDTLCYQLILHGNGDDLRRWANSEQFFDIAYELNGDRPPVYEMLATLFEEYQSLHERYPVLFTGVAPFFSQEVDSWLYNGLVLSALCQLPSGAASRLFTGVLNFLSEQTHSHLFQLKTGIAFFIWNQRTNISAQQFEILVGLMLQQSNLRDDGTIQSVVYALHRQEITFQLTAETTTAMKQLLAEGPGLPSAEWDNYCDLYERSTDGEQKEHLREYAQAKLAAGFTAERYYLACLSGIIPPKKIYSERFTANIKVVVEKGPGLYIQNKTFYTNIAINQFINFCWRFDLPLPDFLVQNAASFGSYYAWLTDIDHFDYSQFDPQWLSFHFTRYYKKRFQQSKVLKSHVLKIMQEKRNPALERFVANTYAIDENGEG